MTANQAMFPIATMCKSFGVSGAGYYAWLGREPSARSIAATALTERIKTIHAASKETYGAPRIHAELIDEGIHVGRKRVERLMKAAGVAGVSRRKAARTTFRDQRVRPACDLVDRNFYADKPDRLWVADITYGAPRPGRSGVRMFGMLLERRKFDALSLAVKGHEPKRRWPVVNWQGDGARG